jgi:hypothetical protein
MQAGRSAQAAVAVRRNREKDNDCATAAPIRRLGSNQRGASPLRQSSFWQDKDSRLTESLEHIRGQLDCLIAGQTRLCEAISPSLNIGVKCPKKEDSSEGTTTDASNTPSKQGSTPDFVIPVVRGSFSATVEETSTEEDAVDHADQGSATMAPSVRLSPVTFIAHHDPELDSVDRPSTFESRAGSMRSMVATYHDLMNHDSSGNIHGSGILSYCAALVPVHPESQLRATIDTFSVFLLLLDSVLMPYTLAWEVRTEGFILAFSWLSGLFWFLDLVMNFFTSYAGPDGVLVTKLNRIAWRYIMSWFVPDVLVVGSDWLSLVFHYLSVAHNGNTMLLRVIRLLKITRFVRIVSMVRSGRLAQVQYVLERRVRSVGLNVATIRFTLGLAKLVFLILWLNHLGGCLWWVFVTHVHSSRASDTDSSWHAEIAEQYETTDLKSDMQRYLFWYLQGVYWSVTAMFSGASFRPPTNSAETIFALFFVIFGMLFGSTLISSVAAMLLDFQLIQRERWEKMRTLQIFLRQHRIAAKLSQEIQTQISRRMNSEKLIARKDVTVLNMLSTRLSNMLKTELHGPVLMTNIFLRICDQLDDVLIQDLATHCVDWLALDTGQKLFATNEHITEAFNITNGMLAYTPKEFLLSEVVEANVNISTEAQAAGLNTNTFDLGPRTWLCELALWCRWSTLGEAEVVTPSELLTLRVEAMVSVMGLHPEVARVMQDYSMTLCKVVELSKPKVSDIREDTDFHEDSVICALPQHSRFKVSRPALQAVYAAAGHDEERRAAAEELEQEVGSGKCWLGHDPESGQVLRMVQLVTLRLTRNDGQVCAKIGEWRGRDQRIMKRRAQLPGGKMRSGEMPHQTVQRLLRSEFPGLAIEIRGKVAEKTEKVPSASYHMTTKYVTTEYAAFLDDGDDLKYVGLLPPDDTPQSPQQGQQVPSSKPRFSRASSLRSLDTLEHIRSEKEPLPIYINGECTAAKAPVYAWLDPDVFKTLQEARHQDAGDGSAVQADFSISTWGKNTVESTEERQNTNNAEEERHSQQQDTI